MSEVTDAPERWTIAEVAVFGERRISVEHRHSPDTAADALARRLAERRKPKCSPDAPPQEDPKGV
jgi:hypothetical protein